MTFLDPAFEEMELTTTQSLTVLFAPLDTRQLTHHTGSSQDEGKVL